MEWRKATNPDYGTYEIPGSWLFLHYYDALNVLFRIENALRVFVYIVLKNELHDKWTHATIADDEGAQGTILSIARRRMSQAKSFGYVGYPITCPILHITSGELIRLITSDAYWRLFKDHFLGSRGIIKNKLEEIGSVRNSLAHFRPIKNDDVDLIKQNAKHVLASIEPFLSSVLNQDDVVPTNTEDTWYKELKTLGTDNCTLSFRQSKNTLWLRIIVKYNCPLLTMNKFGGKRIRYNVLNLISPSILRLFPDLTNLLSYLSVSVSRPRFDEDLIPDFRKSVGLVFGRDVVQQNHETIKRDLESLLLEISKETELIKDDNLARGKLVESSTTFATAREYNGKEYWTGDTGPLSDAIAETDPPEFWGSFGFFVASDFVAETHRYPWMPDDVSEPEVPF